MSHEGMAVPGEALVAPVSLFERYADQQVTFKGVTGTLSSLINLCPVPHDQMDPARIEEWSADILLQSGVEVPPELLPKTPLDNRDELAEQNVAVASEKAPDAQSESRRPITETPTQVETAESAQRKDAEPSIVTERLPAEKIIEQARLAADSTADQSEKRIDDQFVETPISDEPVILEILPSTVPIEPRERPAALEQQPELEPPDNKIRVEKAPFTPPVVADSQPVLKRSYVDRAADTALLEVTTANPVLVADRAAEAAVASMQPDVAELIEEIWAQVLATPFDTPELSEPAMLDVEAVVDLDVATWLPERTAASEALANFLEPLTEPAIEEALDITVAVLQIIESVAALPESTTENRELLIEQIASFCEELLTVLTLPHDEEAVRQFVSSLLDTFDNPDRPRSTISRFEEGTHEQKTSPQQLLYILIDLARQGREQWNWLGRLALQPESTTAEWHPVESPRSE